MIGSSTLLAVVATLAAQPAPQDLTPAQLAGQRVAFAYSRAHAAPRAGPPDRARRGRRRGAVLAQRPLARAPAPHARRPPARGAAVAGQGAAAGDGRPGGRARASDSPAGRAAPRRVGRTATAVADGRTAGSALRAVGANVDLAPVADVCRRGSALERERRCYGRSPRTVTRLAGGFARGLRSRGVAATLKHFPGFGAAGTNTDFSAQLIPTSLGRLRRVDEAPFAALARRSPLVMLTTAVYPARSRRPAALAYPWATRELRGPPALRRRERDRRARHAGHGALRRRRAAGDRDRAGGHRHRAVRGRLLGGRPGGRRRWPQRCAGGGSAASRSSDRWPASWRCASRSLATEAARGKPTPSAPAALAGPPARSPGRATGSSSNAGPPWRSSSTVSSWARLRPMQPRGPAPKGRYWKRSCALRAAGSKRPGSKRSGSGNATGSRWRISRADQDLVARAAPCRPAASRRHSPRVAHDSGDGGRSRIDLRDHRLGELPRRRGRRRVDLRSGASRAARPAPTASTPGRGRPLRSRPRAPSAPPLAPARARCRM